jgi:transcriptional regulator with XRE-family HTH domain
MGLMSKIRSMRFRQGKSISEIARLTSLSRNTIKKWLKAPQGAEPRYRLHPHVARGTGQGHGHQRVRAAEL